MFDALQEAPPDAILGLNEAFRADSQQNKINLTTGVYKDEHGNTPILNCVKKAETRLLEEETSKGYLGIGGDPNQTSAVQELVFGPGHHLLESGLAVTVQTPGGTGALRVAGDFIHSALGGGTIWLSEPTWPNHSAVFGGSGLKLKSYPYYDAVAKELDFEAMKAALEKAPSGEFVLLHACCHNPSGMDPTQEQWKELARLTKDRGLIPFFDFAYQGFGDGLDEDAAGLRYFLEPGRELIIATSYSKNFGLYNERIGALTVVTSSKTAVSAALSQLKSTIRANYSNPPAHGAKIVAAILRDPKLRAEWEIELAAMRNRINAMRKLFVETLAEKGVTQDFSFITRQRGMFSFSGLTKDQVIRLRKEFSIYMVESGRLNVAGITPSNVGPLCDAIAKVMN